MWEDPIVSEVRRTREQLAARFGFDVKAIFDDLRKRQAMLGNRLVTRKQHAKSGDATSSVARETTDSMSASPR
jgi:hypothetical protein